MKFPQFLKKGDQIAVVCPARKIDYRMIEASVGIIKNQGFIPVIGETVGKSNHQFAGTDEERLQDLQKQLDTPAIKAIWCARGGYGTVRIIDQLDFTEFLKHPKWIIGYSDITVLHSHLHNLSVASMHGPLALDLYQCSHKAIDTFTELLSGQKKTIILKSSKKNKIGKASGQLVGGNLSMLYSLCGSPTTIDTRGKILCIEDLDEYLYHMDRMLQNLKRNGYFDQLKGLIVGGMTSMHDNTVPFGKKAKSIILEVVKEYDFPVVFNFPMGHVDDNLALILGAEVELKVEKEEVCFRYV
ncbi:LD-carboxypeptidase [Aquimarina sp. ERC-38]|uniref:S66 peptidase family protein n=1 Tax=Aquimarina sp. ERC-38 TaxID=2949996 RepID=UPI002245FE20|nr:LD-carboxypeptidase [Aquimarina sp. ERC-38]UZO81937.1 LD-carboxypeptidase [Aquimarina sp. ERC-38]